MKNFEFEHNGQKLWYSRSLACSTIILRYDSVNHTVEILASKRGQGCEFNKGLWNVPGGFIDFDEDARECALRETYEETGVKIPQDQIMFQFLDTTPRGKRQTMVAVWAGVFTKKATEDWTFDTSHSEKDEVEEIKWIDLNDLDKYQWTNDQIRNIKRVTHNWSWILDVVGFDQYPDFY